MASSSATNNTDFQSELLQMNGTLQASITELRYHCEVYRLSLRSICKVLASVQKEQDARLRYLTTSRPSFQSYLLNLSQKQALDRIKNVVRKASTFINGYSLVDKQLFQPPPPKPSTACRSGAENKTAPSTSTIMLTDGSGTGWVSKCFSDGTSTSATLPAISEGEVNNGYGVGGSTEAASSKNNNRKVDRKHSSRRRQGREEKKKASASSSKSKSRENSRSSRRHSSSGSIAGNVKHGRINNVDCSDDKSSTREIKKGQNEKGKTVSAVTRKKCFAVRDSRIQRTSRDREKTGKQTRSKSTTTSRNRHIDNHRERHYGRYKVINSRTLSSQRDEEKLEADNNEPGEIVCVSSSESSKGRKQQSPLIGQFGGGINRIPPLFSIATSSASTIKLNKSFDTSHVNEKLKSEARLARRPSNEKQLEGRRTATRNINSGSRTDNENKEREMKATSRSHASRGSIYAIHLKGFHESKTTAATKRASTITTTTRRWGNSSTITAGYKVRESLAVLRNRNCGTGNIRQGQGGVARKYLFSSHRPLNHFRLNFSAVTAGTERVRRVQLNGNGRYDNSGTYVGGRSSSNTSVNEEKPYGASRKSAGNINSNNGTGTSNCVRSSNTSTS